MKWIKVEGVIMRNCIFCLSEGPFTTVEHAIPESLGNDDLVLRNTVCDKCQNYFGKEVENYVLSKTPIAFWRVFLGIKTKKGNMPSVDFTQPAKKTGLLPAIHSEHDNNVGFTFHEDNWVSVDIDNAEILQGIADGTKNELKFVFTPKVVSMMGRFFLKVGLEILSLNNVDIVRDPIFDEARRYARFGKGNAIWPIFHY